MTKPTAAANDAGLPEDPLSHHIDEARYGLGRAADLVTALEMACATVGEAQSTGLLAILQEIDTRIDVASDDLDTAYAKALAVEARQITTGPASDAALIAGDAEHARASHIVESTELGDSEINAASDALSLIEERMCDTRAETIEGMRAKARTLQRLMESDFRATGGFFPPGADDIGRMTWSLALDLTQAA